MKQRWHRGKLVDNGERGAGDRLGNAECLGDTPGKNGLSGAERALQEDQITAGKPFAKSASKVSGLFRGS